MSEGEIDEGETPAVDTSNLLSNGPDQQSSEGEVEEEGKSQSRKRRKSMGKKSKQSPKSKKQKRRHASLSKPGANPAVLPDYG